MSTLCKQLSKNQSDYEDCKSQSLISKTIDIGAHFVQLNTQHFSGDNQQIEHPLSNGTVQTSD